MGARDEKNAVTRSSHSNSNSDQIHNNTQNNDYELRLTGLISLYQQRSTDSHSSGHKTTQSGECNLDCTMIHFVSMIHGVVVTGVAVVAGGVVVEGIVV